jgi:hypothetical protein
MTGVGAAINPRAKWIAHFACWVSRLFRCLAASDLVVVARQVPTNGLLLGRPICEEVRVNEHLVILGFFRSHLPPNIKVMMSRIGFERGPNERIVINNGQSHASPYTGESLHLDERDSEDCDS